MISFIVPGDPVPQGRPRFTTRGGFPRAYDPANSRDFKAKVAAEFRWAIVGHKLIEGPLILEATFYLRRPLRLMARKWPETALACDKRPDLDNLVKAIKDALTGLAYRDDGQICEYRCRKMYHEKSGAQRTEIKICPA